MKNNLQNMLIFYRKKNKWSQEEVAKMLHMTRSAYANYEQGTRRPKYEALEALADLYNTNITTLLGVDTDYLDENEVYIIESYREMNESDKKHLIAYLKAFQQIKD